MGQGLTFLGLFLIFLFWLSNWSVPTGCLNHLAAREIPNRGSEHLQFPQHHLTPQTTASNRIRLIYLALYNKKVSLEQCHMYFGTYLLQRVNFTKRSHISWQCSLKTAKNAYSMQPFTHQIPWYKKHPSTAKCSPGSTIHAFWNICSSASWFSKNGPRIFDNVGSRPMHFQANPLITKFRRAKEPPYNKHISLEQCNMYIGTFLLQRVYF